jgi:hypothetical protein
MKGNEKPNKLPNACFCMIVNNIENNKKMSAFIEINSSI